MNNLFKYKEFNKTEKIGYFRFLNYPEIKTKIFYFAFGNFNILESYNKYGPSI